MHELQLLKLNAMRTIFLYSRYIAISAFLFIGCSKNSISDKEKRADFTTSDTYTTEVNNQSARAISSILTDENFIKIAETLRKVAVINNANASVLSEPALNGLLQELKTASRAEEAQAIFEKYGVPNSTELFSNFNKLPGLATDLFSKNAAFKNVSKQEATELLQGSMQAYFNEHPITYRELLNGDQCSQAYAVGMAGCDNSFVIEIAAIFGGVIFGVWTGFGIIPTAASVSGAITIAWAHLHSCQQGVIANFRICRANNPTH
jgi:PBP1b-binding outer membrane lipoprotein LpoB